MTHLSAKLKRISVFFLALVFLIGAMPAISISAATSSVSDSIQDVLDLLTSDTYNTYSELHKDEKRADEDIGVDVADYTIDENDSPATVVTLNDFAHSETPVVVMGSSGKLSWTVNVPTSAKYAIKIEYFTKVTEDDIKTAAEEAGYTEDEITDLISKTAAIQRMLFIDNEIIFTECRSLEFDVSWADEYTLTDTYTTLDGKVYNAGDTILSTDEDFYDLIMNPANAKDTEEFGPRIFFRDYSEESYETVSYENRNEMRPSKVQISEWKTQPVEDSSGYYTNPFEFYLTEGEHTITLESVREPMAIKSITLYPVDDLPTYEEYLKMYSDKSDADCEAIVIQTEYSKSTSSQTIYQIADTSSSISQPNDTSRERLNTIGGDKWQYAGDWITWDVEVEQSGFYEIVLRSIQNYYSGTYVSRALYIDGEIPFEEASRLRYNYSQKFTTAGLNVGETDENGEYITYKVYLEKGRREISLKVVLGDMGVLLSQIEECMNTINEYRRKLLMVTGPDPDEYRDYNFDKTMPAVLRGFKTQAALFYAISDQLEEIIGSVGDHTVILDKTAFILERMGTYPTKIASLMDDLKDYIGSLGTWLMDTQNQPLLIDYISIQSPSDELPQADANFFQAAYAEIKKFIASFFSDYNTIGSKTLEEYTDDGAVTAWIVTGRDNAKIIRTMISDMFISETNISLNLKLVAAGTLLPATLAGTGPDVSFSSAGDAINYAIRSAVLPLNDFKDIEALDEIIYGATGEELVEAIKNDTNYFAPESFDEVMARFSPAALTPLTLYGKTYGVPETQSFMMLFYRKDILAEMGLEVPKTWDEFYDTIFTLQEDNLNIGFPSGLSGTLMLMYQQSETLYKEGDYDEYTKLMLQLYPEDTVKKMLREEGIENHETLSYMDGLVALNKFYINDDGEYIPTTDGMEINLGSDTALKCFKQVCELFTMWDFPVTYDFANRFRSGEMPMAIMDYTGYNQLIVFAPEIEGLWEFTTLPGTVVNEDTGEINYNSVSGVSAVVMMKGVETSNDDRIDALKKKNAWAFMSWWTDSAAQSKYATEMEALLGPSAKQATANLEALYSMPWSTSEYKNLSDQFANLTATPEYPGGYIIGRYGSFAFLSVYNAGTEPVETMQGYLDDINKELTRKRQEFNLPTADDFAELLND